MGLLIPCFILLVISGSESATQVVNGTLGRSVFLYESISDQGLSLQWNFRNLPIASRFPGLSPGCTDVYAGRCQLYDNGTLRLDNLRATDDGTYTFTALRPPSTIVKETSYDLKTYPVLTGAVLTSNSTKDHLIGGTHVSLHCDASNQTVTIYTFYRDGENICSKPNVSCQDAYLHFKPITESDSGIYTCTIQNPVSSNNSNTLQLIVIVAVSDVKLTSNITGLVWPGLDSVSLNCSARGTNVSYSWNLQGAPLPSDTQYHLSENKQVLTINPVSNKENGTFTCTASNLANNMTSNGINLRLASGVSNVTLTGNMSGSYIWAGEESVSLHCSADGSDVTFVWNLNEKPLPEDPRYNTSQNDSPPYSNLLISPVSRNDDGLFTCDASNRFGNKTSNALRLNLAWTPEGNINCTAKPKGQNVTLGCSWPGGQPAANVSLNFSDITDKGQNNVSKEVSTGGNFRGSTLTCQGDQLGRTSKCSLSLDLPKATAFNNNTITKSKVGETIDLTVILEPGLPAQFKWYHPNSSPIQGQMSRKALVESTDSSSTLQIQSLTSEDAGKYECRATNIIGTQSFLFTVEVSKSDLDGGAIAGIVVGVLAAVTLIGILVFFLVKKKKRSGDSKGINAPEDQQETSVQYATVLKKNGGVAETTLENEKQEDDVKYAVIKFPNNSINTPVPPPVETEYSTVKTPIKQ